MQKFQEFQEAYDDAVVTINQFLTDTQCAEMQGLVQWLMTTDASPYSYLPSNWVGSVNTAEGFASLLYHIHHAVYDDGDICFITVNGEPRIRFLYRHDPRFRDLVLNNSELVMEKDGRRTYDIQVLDITPNEFGEVYDAWQKKDLRRRFILDSVVQGTKWASDYYRNRRCWDESWVTECAEEIENKKASRQRQLG